MLPTTGSEGVSGLHADDQTRVLDHHLDRLLDRVLDRHQRVVGHRLRGRLNARDRPGRLW